LKDSVRVSLVQFAPKWLEGAKNAERMKDVAVREVEAGADLIVFPETANAGHITPLLPGDPVEFPGSPGFAQFFQKYVEASEPVPGATTRLLEAVARDCGVHIVVGLAERHPVIPATIFDSAVLLGPHGLIGVQRKVHLGFGEKLFFAQGAALRVYDTGLGKVGLIVGHDAWFPEICRVMAIKGAEILCHLSQSPALPGAVDEQLATDLAITRARENAVYFLACNRAGAEGKYEMIGHSAIVGPTGAIVAGAETRRETVVSAELTAETLIKARGLLTVLRDRRPALYAAVCEPSGPGTGVLASQSRLG